MQLKEINPITLKVLRLEMHNHDIKTFKNNNKKTFTAIHTFSPLLVMEAQKQTV